jgi:hypothetical protein
MKWILILLCINITNANDIPGKVTLQFETKEQCESSLKTMTYNLKFDTFKVVGNCEEVK